MEKKNEFFHPKIEIVSIPGKGRGLIALENLEVGELLIIEEPIVVSDSSDPSIIVDKLLDHKVASEQLWYPPKFKLVSSVFEDVSDEDYSRALAQINCNAFHWEGKFILTYRCSFINHSCWPNASLVFTNESLIKVFTIQFVPKGEEICICYKTQLLYMPTLLRQEKLKAIYEFDCACCRCVPSQVSPNPHDHLMTKVYHVPEDSIQVQKAISFMENFYENLNVKYQSKEFILWQFSDLRRRLLEEFLQRPFGLEFSATKLDLSHWRMNFIRRELISLYLEREKYFDALKLLVQQMKSEELLLPKFHNAKLAAYVAYKEVLSKVTPQEQNNIKELAKEIDINTLERIINIFGLH